MKTVYIIDGNLGTETPSVLDNLKIYLFFCSRNVYKEPETFEEPFRQWSEEPNNREKCFRLAKTVLDWQMSTYLDIAADANENGVYIVENSFARTQRLYADDRDYHLIDMQSRLNQLFERAKIKFDFTLRSGDFQLMKKTFKSVGGPPPNICSGCKRRLDNHCFPTV